MNDIAIINLLPMRQSFQHRVEWLNNMTIANGGRAWVIDKNDQFGCLLI